MEKQRPNRARKVAETTLALLGYAIILIALPTWAIAFADAFGQAYEFVANALEDVSVFFSAIDVLVENWWHEATEPIREQMETERAFRAAQG